MESIALEVQTKHLRLADAALRLADVAFGGCSMFELGFLASTLSSIQGVHLFPVSQQGLFIGILG